LLNYGHCHHRVFRRVHPQKKEAPRDQKLKSKNPAARPENPNRQQKQAASQGQEELLPFEEEAVHRQ